MRYYFRHLYRCVKKKPTQPLLMTLVLCLSFIIMFLALTLSFSLNDENNLTRQSTYGETNLMVSISNKSVGRFLSLEDAQALIPQDRVTGSMTIPCLYEGALIGGVGVDFDTIGQIFSLTFCDIQPITKSDKNEAVYISKVFAKNHHLKVGDDITLSIFGQDVTYKIYGIATQTFLGSNDILCDISSVIQTLTKNSPFFSILTDDVKLFGTLYIQTSTMEETRQILIENYPNEVISETSTMALVAQVNIWAAISGLLVGICFFGTFIVVLGCSYCLAKERAEFSFLFSLVGFSKKRALFYRILEMVVYSLVAIFVGIPLSIPLGILMFRSMGFNFASFSINIPALLISSFVVILIAILPPCFPSKEKKERKKQKLIFVFSIVSFIFATLSLFLQRSLLRGQQNFIVAVVAGGLFFFILFLLPPEIIPKISQWFSRKRKNPIKTIAIKNCGHIGELGNTLRMFSVLSYIFFMLIFLLISSIGMIKATSEWFKGDYVIIGGNEKTEDILDQMEEVDGYTRFRNCSSVIVNGKPCLAWGTDDISSYEKHSKIQELPKGNIAYTSYVYANECNLKEGDTFTIVYGGKEYSFLLKETFDDVEMAFLVDYDFLENDAPQYLVSKKDGISKEELFNALSRDLSTQMVGITSMNSLTDYYTRNNYRYITYCYIILFMVVLFGLVGIGNNAVESYRSRKNELYCFSLSGVTKKQIRFMLKTEYLFVLCIGIVFFLVSSIFAAFNLNYGMYTYATNAFYVYKMLLGLA